jgi:hypothetical protein
MRRASVVWLTVVLVGSSALAAQPPPPPRSSTATIKTDLVALYQRFLDGLRTRDTASLGRLLTDDYVFILSGDSVVTMSRAQRLAGIAADPDSVSSLVLEHCDIRLYGSAATGTCRIRERNVTQSRWEAIQSSVTFIRGIDRRWRLGMVHASLVRPRD